MIKAGLGVDQIRFSMRYLEEARRLNEFVYTHFFDHATNLYYFTSADQSDMVTSKKEIYDFATPSENAMLALKLLL